jgi:poly(A) polymerase
MHTDLNKKVPKDHIFILDLLNAHRYEAFICGGAVRDLLLGIEPKDFDITTSATPEVVAELFQYHGYDVDRVGVHFGVSLVKMQGQAIEVATFRKDGRYTDGRRPDDVELVTNPGQDVSRRDFTINGLLLNQHGRVYDFTGLGLADLRDRTLRTIGNPNDRFREDPVRMLRAVRFASKLEGFSLHQDTARAIVKNRERLKDVAVERVRDELVGILQSGNVERGIALMSGLLLFPYVLPELGELRTTPQNPKYHPEGSVYIHTLGLLRQLTKGCSVTLALAALLHDIGKPATFDLDKEGQPTFHGHEDVGAIMTNEILHRLKFPTEIIQKVQILVAEHMRFRVIEDMRKSKRLRFIRQPNFGELLTLHKMDALAGSGNLSNYKFALQTLAETPDEVIRPVKLVTGADLIDLGLTPGPLFKTILERIEDAQLEGLVTNKAEGLFLATQFIGGDR